MADLATLLARRDALEEARATGLLTVEVDGRRLTYKSDEDMARALAAITRDITAAGGNTGAGSASSVAYLTFKPE